MNTTDWECESSLRRAALTCGLSRAGLSSSKITISILLKSHYIHHLRLSCTLSSHICVLLVKVCVWKMDLCDTKFAVELMADDRCCCAEKSERYESAEAVGERAVLKSFLPSNKKSNQDMRWTPDLGTRWFQCSTAAQTWLVNIELFANHLRTCLA